MLRLGECFVSRLLSSPPTSAISPLLRLLSASASASPTSPNPSGFAVEEYLVGTCGLTRPQALRASLKLSHLKSPANPDAVLAFLAGLGLSGADAAAVVARDPRFLCASVDKTLAPVVAGLSGADAAAVVARDPRFLCASVDKTLAPVVAGLTGLGLSRPEIGRLVSLAHCGFRSRPMVSKMQYCLPLFGSFDNFLRALQRGSCLISSDLGKVIKPNVVFLRECGLSDCDIVKLCVPVPRMLTANPERVRTMVACAERLGVPRGSGMLRQALQAVAFLSEEKVAAKLEYLKNTFRWSDAEVSIAVCKAPMVLKKSKESLKRMSEFLFSEVGLEPMYIAHRPIILCLSLEGRVKPRYYVVKFLKQNGLLDHDWSFNSAVMVTEKVFMEKFICPHKEAAPHLAEDYATACKGKVPTSIIFRSTVIRL